MTTLAQAEQQPTDAEALEPSAPRSRKTDYAVCYVGWLGQANVGDEILFDIFQRLWMPRFDRISGGQGTCRVDAHIPNDQYVRDLSRYDLIVLGGGSILGLPYYIDLTRVAKRLGIPVAVWGSGIDGLTESTVSALNHLPLKQIDPMVNLDFLGLQEMMKYAEVAGVRGPDTFELLRSLGFARDETVICGDPGLLISPSKQEGVPDFEGLEGKEKLVGINFGATTGPVFGGRDAPKRAATALAKFVDQLIADNYCPVFFALWPSDIMTNLSVIEQMKQKDKVYHPGRVHEGPLLARLMKRFEFTVGLKLHANVISAAMEVPFISLAYRSKCFDFAKSIGSPDLVASLSSTNLFSDIKRIHEKITASPEEYRERLRTFNRRYSEEVTALTDKAVSLVLSK